MRTAFVNRLLEEAGHNDRIFLIVGDLGYNVVEPFRDHFPDRFLNAGIAEQNMVGVASGLAREGFNVYIYSIANFPTLRCLEQIRNDVAYYGAKGNVKIVAVGAGYAYGSLGVSHHATEDLGIMRSLPGLVIASPSDPSEAQAVATFSSTYEGPMYIRLGKAGEKAIFNDAVPYRFEPGRLHLLQESESRNVLLSTGSILFGAVEDIRRLGIDTAIYSVPCVKPIDKAQIADIAERHPNIVVLEEHQKSCGLGSAIAEQLVDLFAENRLSHFPKIHRVAIEDRYTTVAGTEQYLRELNGLVIRKELFV